MSSLCHSGILLQSYPLCAEAFMHTAQLIVTYNEVKRISKKGSELKNKYCLIFICFTVAVFLSACGNGSVPTLAITPSSPKSLEVTGVPFYVTTNSPMLYQEPPETSVATSLSASIRTDKYDVNIGPEYFDGIIVLTRYYTLFLTDFIEELLPLYSSSLLKKNGGNNFEVDVRSSRVL